MATTEATYDPLMHELASFILLMQRGDGSFLSEWDRTTDLPYPNETSTYSTGEAFWALTLMHRVFPNEGWDKPSHAVADYVSFQRDLKEHQKYPPWADQWSAYGFAEMAAWPDAVPAGKTPLTDTNVAYARTLAERFGFLMRVESQRRDNWFSRLTHGPEARSAGMATWVEGLDSLWRLAGKDSRLADLRPKIAERALCGAGMLVDRQVVGGDRVKAHPVEALGAWFTDGKTRMDDQQHALSGLLAAAVILRERGK